MAACLRFPALPGVFVGVLFGVLTTTRADGLLGVAVADLLPLGVPPASPTILASFWRCWMMARLETSVPLDSWRQWKDVSDSKGGAGNWHTVLLAPGFGDLLVVDLVLL